MKKNILLIITFLMLPTLLVYNQKQTINVFDVNGKLFLQYYIMLITLSVLAILITKITKLQIIISSLVITIGIIKTFVGLTREKPVGFLVALILVYFVFNFVFVNTKKIA
jgi:uncharacterized Tic20 family protein